MKKEAKHLKLVQPWKERGSKDIRVCPKMFAVNPLPAKPIKGTWTRNNGDYTLYMYCPYEGTLPHGNDIKIIIWLSSEVNKTKTKDVHLKSLRDVVVNELGDSWCPRSNKRFVDGLRRIASTSCLFEKRPDIEVSRARWEMEHYTLIENKKELIKITEGVTTDITLRVSHWFYEQLIDFKRRVPHDREVVRRCGKNYFLLCFYLWLVERVNRMKKQKIFIKFDRFRNHIHEKKNRKDYLLRYDLRKWITQLDKIFLDLYGIKTGISVRKTSLMIPKFDLPHRASTAKAEASKITDGGSYKAVVSEGDATDKVRSITEKVLGSRPKTPKVKNEETPVHG